MSRNEDISITKFKLSYVHNAYSFPFQYKTVAQRLDELAVEYPDYECHIFKGIVSALLMHTTCVLFS